MVDVAILTVLGLRRCDTPEDVEKDKPVVKHSSLLVEERGGGPYRSRVIGINPSHPIYKYMLQLFLYVTQSTEFR